MQEVREAIAKLGNIALKYMSTNAEEFVHIVIGEPEAEACGPTPDAYWKFREKLRKLLDLCLTTLHRGSFTIEHIFVGNIVSLRLRVKNKSCARYWPGGVSRKGDGLAREQYLKMTWKKYCVRIRFG